MPTFGWGSLAQFLRFTTGRLERSRWVLTGIYHYWKYVHSFQAKMEAVQPFRKCNPQIKHVLEAGWRHVSPNYALCLDLETEAIETSQATPVQDAIKANSFKDKVLKIEARGSRALVLKFLLFLVEQGFLSSIC